MIDSMKSFAKTCEYYVPFFTVFNTSVNFDQNCKNDQCCNIFDFPFSKTKIWTVKNAAILFIKSFDCDFSKIFERVDNKKTGR